MAQPIIELKNITFTRNNHNIIENLSWTIEPGQHWALLGANGSGKTTLLKIITGYEWPTAGTVTVLNQRFGSCDIRELRKHVGWVSSAIEHRLPGHHTAFKIALSGFEASLGLYRYFSTDEKEQAQHALKLLNIQHLAQRTYDTLSQGEKQRVLIARALVHQPQLLILDEPCAGLDPAARQAFLNDLHKLTLAPQCPTITLVTHHIDEIAPWINHTLILKQGQALAKGPKLQTLTEKNLANAFNHPCTIEQSNQQYILKLKPEP